MSRVWIVGGGLSGLTAAYYLAQAGLRPTLVEAQPRLGGLLRTKTIEGAVIEEGPDSYLAAKPWAFQFLRELGLEHEVIGSNDPLRRTHILRHGELVPLPEGFQMVAPSEIQPILDTPLLNWESKLKVGHEYYREPGSQPHPERSVADLVRDHYGHEYLDYLVEPLLAGVYGGSPETLSANAVLPRFVDLEAKYGSLTRGVIAEKPAKGRGSMFQTLRNGWGTLVEALQTKLNGTVDHMHAQVEFVESGRLKIQGQWHPADYILLACPAWAAGNLLHDSAPALARHLHDIPYTSAMTVALGYNEYDISHPLNGFGFLVPAKERRRVAACTWVNSKFPHRIPTGQTVLRCFLGSGDDAAILDESDTDILTIVQEELRDIMGVTASPRYTHFSRWPRSMPQYTLGHAMRVQTILDSVAALPGLAITGNAYHGIGIPDTIRMAKDTAQAVSRSVLSSRVS